MLDDLDLDSRLTRAGALPALESSALDEVHRMRRRALAEAEASAPARDRVPLVRRIGLKPALLAGAVALGVAGCTAAVVAVQMQPVTPFIFVVPPPHSPEGDWTCEMTLVLLPGDNPDGLSIEEFAAGWSSEELLQRVEEMEAVFAAEWQQQVGEGLTGSESEIELAMSDEGFRWNRAVSETLRGDLESVGFAPEQLERFSTSCQDLG